MPVQQFKAPRAAFIVTRGEFKALEEVWSTAAQIDLADATIMIVDRPIPPAEADEILAQLRERKARK